MKNNSTEESALLNLSLFLKIKKKASGLKSKKLTAKIILQGCYCPQKSSRILNVNLYP